MAITLDILAKYNATGIDLHGCYGRIENMHYHYKTCSIKCTFSVYYNEQVGKLRRRPEEHMSQQVESAMRITGGKPITGAMAREFTLGRDPILMDSGTLFHPQFVYSDTYAVKVPIEEVNTEEKAYAFFYNLIKQDDRFRNVVDC